MNFAICNKFTPVAVQGCSVIDFCSFSHFQPPKKMTAAQKSLAKVDKTGMKPMSSFFSPKVKAQKKWVF